MSQYDTNSGVWVGTLVKDAENKAVGDKSVTNMTIANNRGSEASFLSIEVWGKTAEFCAQLKKGERVAVTGSLKQDTWTNKEGKKQSNLKIVASQVQALNKRTGSVTKQEPTDDVPF